MKKIVGTGVLSYFSKLGHNTPIPATFQSATAPGYIPVHTYIPIYLYVQVYTTTYIYITGIRVYKRIRVIITVCYRIP